MKGSKRALEYLEDSKRRKKEEGGGSRNEQEEIEEEEEEKTISKFLEFSETPD